ncbi:MAG: hypothetical protein U0350_48235 [Caldilineaceae bacterium]
MHSATLTSIGSVGGRKAKRICRICSLTSVPLSILRVKPTQPFRRNACTRLSAAEVRQQLIDQKGYQDAELPTAATIGNKLNALGYRLRPVQKSRPQKTAETDAIFGQLERLRQHYQADPTVLRLSLDAKATVLIGDYSRGGKVGCSSKRPTMTFSPRPS